MVDFDFAATANNLLKLFKGGNKPQIAANFTKHIIAAANDAHTIRISNQVRELYEQADAAIVCYSYLFSQNIITNKSCFIGCKI